MNIKLEFTVTSSFNFVFQSRGPGVPRKVGPCSYEMLWETSLACELTETDTGDSSAGDVAEACAITDGNYTYSLTSLKKTGDEFYTVQTPDKSRTFRVSSAFVCWPS